MTFPDGFFDRADPRPDDEFYAFPRFVTHIDDGAIAAVGDLYARLGLRGAVLDLMSSWVSHFRDPPARLVALGMSEAELMANPQAAGWVVQDLNRDPALPFADDEFDDATCCVSVDYLTRPVDVFSEVRRVVRPGGRFVVTFSNRLFPTKAIAGWLYATDDARASIVTEYFHQSGGWEQITVERISTPGDPLLAVSAAVGGSAAPAAG